MDLNTTTQTQKNLLNSLTSEPINNKNAGYKIQVEKISQLQTDLESEKVKLESELKLIVNDIKLQKELIEILISNQISTESEKKTVLSKTKQVKHNINQPKEQQTNPTYKLKQQPENSDIEEDFNLIIVFEQTGRETILKARQYIEDLLNQFIKKLNPKRAHLLTFDDKEYKIWEIVENKVILPELDQQGWFFKDYNQNKPNYSFVIEGILQILENYKNNRTVSLLICQGLENPVNLPNAQKILKCDPRHKMFILGIESESNFLFWDKLSSDINQSDRNEKTGQDFYEVVKDKKLVQEKLQKFQDAMQLEKQKDSHQSKKKTKDPSISQHQITKDKNQATIARSQMAVNLYKQQSKNDKLQKLQNDLESVQASLNFQIQEATKIQKELSDKEESTQIKIKQISTQLSECIALKKIFRSKIEPEKEDIKLPENVKKDLEDYLGAKNELSSYISQLMLTIQKLNTNPIEDITKIKKNIITQTNNLKYLLG